MSDIPAKIDEIIRERKKCLPRLKEIKDTCDKLGGALNNAEGALEELNQGPDDNAELKGSCEHYFNKISEFRKTMNDLEKDVLLNKIRFGRDTINIGFAGTKGTGKSFLLQKLSGLTDNEVPSGEGLPVTAVRCTINNSEENKAHVIFYDERGLIRERLAPFFRAVGVTAPDSLDEFIKMDLSKAGDGSDKAEILRQKLQEFQENHKDFAEYLSGKEKTFELPDLRKFVSYSVKKPDGTSGKCYTYLAVSNVTINCPFPRTDVKALQLIDLPGLGELDPSLESRHTEGFKDNVDVCLFVRRPSGTRMDWDQEAQKALDVITDSSPVSKKSDFAILVINSGNCNKDNAAVMIEETRSKLDERYKILATGSSDSAGLSADLLAPSLNHLADKLPGLDAAIISGLTERLSALKKDIRDFAEKVSQAFGDLCRGQDTPQEILFAAAQKAKGDFSLSSDKILAELDEGAHDKEIMQESIDKKIQEIQKGLEDYLQNGMNHGSRAAWNDYVARRISVAGGVGPVVTEMLNLLRVEIALRVAALENLFRAKVEEVQEKIVHALNGPNVLNNMLDKGGALENLQYFLDCVMAVETPDKKMSQAIKRILDLKIDFNTQIYPSAYEPVRRLRKLIENITSLDYNKVESLHMHLTQNGLRTMTNLRATLLEKADLVFNIVSVAYDFFSDTIIRGPNADKEWLRFFTRF